MAQLPVHETDRTPEASSYSTDWLSDQTALRRLPAGILSPSPRQLHSTRLTFTDRPSDRSITPTSNDSVCEGKIAGLMLPVRGRSTAARKNSTSPRHFSSKLRRSSAPDQSLGYGSADTGWPEILKVAAMRSRKLRHVPRSLLHSRHLTRASLDKGSGSKTDGDPQIEHSNRDGEIAFICGRIVSPLDKVNSRSGNPAALDHCVERDKRSLLWPVRHIRQPHRVAGTELQHPISAALWLGENDEDVQACRAGSSRPDREA